MIRELRNRAHRVQSAYDPGWGLIFYPGCLNLGTTAIRILGIFRRHAWYRRIDEAGLFLYY